jgi:hypothetical protein
VGYARSKCLNMSSAEHAHLDKGSVTADAGDNMVSLENYLHNATVTRLAHGDKEENRDTSTSSSVTVAGTVSRTVACKEPVHDASHG